MYSPAIEKIVYWLEKAQAVAAEPQKSNIAALISYYKTGDLREFDRYNIGWVKDTVSNVDFVNGFIEDYGDPLGRKASWEGQRRLHGQGGLPPHARSSRRTRSGSRTIRPSIPAYRKEKVKGVSAKVITVAMLGGDCYPATPIGINLPNADWIRKEYGSKSVTIDNITYAYDMAAHGNGFNEEFVLRAEDRARDGQVRQAGRRPAHRPARVSGPRFGPAGSGRQGRRAEKLRLDARRDPRRPVRSLLSGRSRNWSSWGWCPRSTWRRPGMRSIS